MHIVNTHTQFEITASAPPTDDDKANIKASIANSTGLELENILNFDVTYISARRLTVTNSHDFCFNFIIIIIIIIISFVF
jgi:hypothetical protein